MEPHALTETRVVVVGAGPVGLVTALGLARAGVPVTVLERHAEIPSSPRAMVYHPVVLDGLDDLGILGDVAALGYTTKEALWFKHFATGEQIRWRVDVLDGLVRHPYTLYLGQHRLAQVAMEHLRRLPGVDVRFGAQVSGVEQDDRGVTITIRTPSGATEHVRAGWCVGTDGARSRVRESLGLAFVGTTWPERFVATNVRYDFGALGYGPGNFLIDPDLGAVIARIDDQGLWRCTYCEDLELPETTIPERMPEYFRRILPAGTGMPDVVQWSPYRMHQRAAERLRVGRVLLAGDAAHSTNPTGALGLTSGLADAFILHETLAAVVGGVAGEETLDRYSGERLRVFSEIVTPQASEWKRLVYHSRDPERLERDLERLRHIADDPEARREGLLAMRALRTESLVA